MLIVLHQSMPQCSAQRHTGQKKTLTLILALRCIFFFFFLAFLCKSPSKTNLSSFWNKPIMNLEEKCIFRFGGGGGYILKAVKSSLLYATICPSKLIHIEASNRVLRRESNTALSKDTVELDFCHK